MLSLLGDPQIEQIRIRIWKRVGHVPPSVPCLLPSLHIHQVHHPPRGLRGVLEASSPASAFPTQRNRPRVAWGQDRVTRQVCQ